MLIKQLGIKFKNLPKNYEEKIKELSEDKIEEIGLNIFNLNNLNDLNQYL